MNIVEKLRDRKVVQWTAGYFAVAWGLLEVLGFLADQFGWPGLIVRGATVLLGTGLLLVITVAWNHGDQGKQRVTRGEMLLIAAIIGLGGILTHTLAPGNPNGQMAAGPVARLTITLPRDQLLGIKSAYSHPFAISPDGSRIAYVAIIDGMPKLAIRALDSFEAIVIEDTDGAGQPFFSPDGRWLGYFGGGQLHKVPADGGAPVAITAIDSPPLGASWGPDGSIIYSLVDDGLWIVPAAGGTPEQVEVRIDVGEGGQPNLASLVAGAGLAWPSFLPDGRHAVATAPDSIVAIDLETGVGRELVQSFERARYVATGHLLLTETGEKLLAVRFDPDSLEVSGSAFPVLDDVFRGPAGGALLYDVSENGTLAFVTGGFKRSLHIADRYGRTRPLTDDKRGFRWVRFSPDGKRVAVSVDPRPTGLWVYDVDRGTGEPVTTDGHNLMPVWSRSSERIIFSRGPGPHIVDPSDPGSLARLTPEHDFPRFYPTSTSADQRSVYGNMRGSSTRWDIAVLHLTETPVLEFPVATAGNDHTSRVSPDDRFLAFNSDISGRFQVYVQPRDGGAPRVRVSIDGGRDVAWSPDGGELYFRQGKRIMVARMTGPLSFSEPELLFIAPDLDITQQQNWDAGRDGQFALVISDPATTSEFQVVTNWFSVLTERERN
jgi:serine/threonine-protein kinase